jgi:hypothetical protein
MIFLRFVRNARCLFSAEPMTPRSNSGCTRRTKHVISRIGTIAALISVLYEPTCEWFPDEKGRKCAFLLTARVFCPNFSGFGQGVVAKSLSTLHLAEVRRRRAEFGKF